MHTIQEKLLALIRHQDIGALSLRQIGKLIGIDNKPQVVKHHLLQLEKSGLIQLNSNKGIIKPVSRGFNLTAIKNVFYSLPIVGSANCGPATIFADERIEAYLKVSAKFLPHRKQDLYVLVASGPSMNKADIHDGITIEDGDFVVIDSAYKKPADNDIVVAVIDGMGTIKRYRKDKINNRIILESDSTESYLPIFIYEGDDFTISGKVMDVIKKSTM